MSELNNANPTIRNASDLPSRQRRPYSHQICTKHSPEIFTNIIPSSAYAPDPFLPYPSSSDQEGSDDDSVEPIDEQEIYDLISPMCDPEHPLTLGSLSVVNLPDIHIEPLKQTPSLSVVTVLLTPTVTHCSLATIIGLGVRVRLEQALPPRFRVDVKIKEGTHSTADSLTRQLGDKERVAAALENDNIIAMLRNMLATCR